MKAQQKRKALFVILAVSALTLYNILPTIFFYSNNLKSEITKSSSMKIGSDIAKRVNKLEGESIAWIHSYCKLLHVKPTKISLKEKTPDAINITFKSEKDARVFKSHMTKAGNLIPFFPKKMLPLESGDANVDSKTVTLKREIPIHFDLNTMEKYFSYVPMYKKDGSISSEYRDILDDRILEVSKVVTSNSTSATNIERTMGDEHIGQKTPYFLSVANTILQYKSLFENDRALQQRFYSSALQSNRHEQSFLYDHCLSGFKSSKDYIQKEKIALLDTIKEEELDEKDATLPEVGALRTLKDQEEMLLNAITLLQNKKTLFVATTEGVEPALYSTELKNKKIEDKEIFTLSTGGIIL